MTRTRTRTLLTATAAAALVLGTAGPAAADHVVSYSGDTCYAGELASGTGLALETTTMSVKQLADGSIRFTCVFRGLPESTTAEENGYVDWERPARATRGSTLCEVGDDPSGLRLGEGQVLSTPGGTLKIDCLVPAG